MTTGEIINYLFQRFGATGVTVIDCDVLGCTVQIGGHEYSICRLKDVVSVEEVIEGDVTESNKHSQWIEGLLQGKTRNDAGELVEAK